MKKIFLLVFSVISLLIGMPLGASAPEGELGDESWAVKLRAGRLFYFTHGRAVWGHEFGFYKDIYNCDRDTLWLTFSASEEKVKNFIGKDIIILLSVDGKDFKIKIPMLSADTLGFTQIMAFTNWSPGEQLMGELIKGRYVKMQILEPKELEALLDIKEDQFGLEGFADSRKEAGIICRNKLPSQEKK